ncbi:hypothetical protein CTEN210_12580 [Chaetoceros tenuissimus]|uniref:HSF-type DNA-binding domain-containing protein n=1 Tax=Chaetoceros tenuissimus TaxID=426638 RepID=A0AAD3HAL8_9STRA|nr:hypothetical protein CTEN210_12580 [Chaetoceros tenuissimus]
MSSEAKNMIAKATNEMLLFFKKRRGMQKKQVAVKLPEKLLYILNECSNEYSEILCWSKDGKSIFFKKPQAFEDIITPRFFKKKCSFDSFTRKARRWGFSTKYIFVKGDKDSGEKYSKVWVFHNPDFTKETGFDRCLHITTTMSIKKYVPRTSTAGSSGKNVTKAMKSFPPKARKVSCDGSMTYSSPSLRSEAIESQSLLPKEKGSNSRNPISMLLEAERLIEDPQIKEPLPALPPLPAFDTPASGDEHLPRAEELSLYRKHEETPSPALSLDLLKEANRQLELRNQMALYEAYRVMKLREAAREARLLLQRQNLLAQYLRLRQEEQRSSFHSNRYRI